MAVQDPGGVLGRTKRIPGKTGGMHLKQFRWACLTLMFSADTAFFTTFFTNAASLWAPFFQQHFVTACLCHILVILHLFHYYDIMAIGST